MSAAAADAAAGLHAGLAELIGLRLRAAELGAGARRRSADRAAGTQHSPFRGRGMDYAESRPYAVGDDVRHVDWRLTARSGRLHTKLFQAERERTSAVVIDSSPQMAFGTRVCLKSVQAARVAALFTWAALAGGDRLAAAACGSRMEIVAPTGARRGALRVLDALERWQRPEDAAQQPLSATLLALGRVLRPGSHLLLLVDPHALDADADRALLRLRAHHDVIAGLLVDPIEISPPPPARYRLSDGARQQQVDLFDSAASQRWRQTFEGVQSSAIERLRKLGVATRWIRTDDDPVAALRALLRGMVHSEAPT